MNKVVKHGKDRPARVQRDPATLKEDQKPPQTGTVFNIWHLKWSGGDQSSHATQRKAEGRCNIAHDSGYTRADKAPGSYFCLYFARGLCVNGKKCEYLHRLPTASDIYQPSVDCFGRDKFSDYRDDMGGVGSVLRQNRTLYIGQISITDSVDEIVSRHFSEWGQVERIRVLKERGCAFVTYRYECNAQFAKEAMAHQSLDHDEVLNVRWATADPNPRAKDREQRRLEEQAVEVIKRALPESVVKQIEAGEYQDTSKRRRIEISVGEGDSGQGEGDRGDNEPLAVEQNHTTKSSVQKGLLSSQAIESLKRLNSLPKITSVDQPKSTALVDYESDSE